MPATDDGQEYYQEVALGSCRSTFVEAGNEPPQPGLKRYLCYFLHRFLEFRIPEIEALAELATGPLLSAAPRDRQPSVLWERPDEGLASPFWYAHLPSDAVVFLEVWGEGETWEGLFEAIRAYPQELKQPYEKEDQSFRFIVDCYGAKLQTPQQVEVVEQFAWMGFKGPIDLRNPQHKFWVIIVDNQNSSNLMPLKPKIYFGREVAAGDRLVIPRYDLRQRRYLGPTSMDTEMAFLMCNMGKVRKSSLVFDPFVGTGSILVAAAERGALTLGADIDMRILKLGKQDKAGQRLNIWTNFRDYGLPAPLGLLRADLHRHPFKRAGGAAGKAGEAADAAAMAVEGILDAIVCDPPYGVRAGGRKGAAKEDASIKDRRTHIVATDGYSLGECLRDLMELAAQMLVLGGRLVYFLPAIPGWHQNGDIPTHPALELVADSEQILGSKYSRRLITMEKAHAYDPLAAQQHHAALGPPRMDIDELREHVYSKAGASELETSSSHSGPGAEGGAATSRVLRPVPKHRSKHV
ncbi:hypothetical protein N2152v2_000965 [Parachlorella kessleri]